MNIILKLLKKGIKILGIKSASDYYKTLNYLEAYSKHTDDRVEMDPKTAIGVEWEKIGLLQKKFLIRKGLKPQNTLLDYGCGTLRAGQHLIEYLDKDCYTGIDISKKVIDFAQDFVNNNTKLVEKMPKLVWNKNMSLDFEMFKVKFDYIIAQSVFTHLKPEHCEEIIRNIHKIMNENSKFYFTIFTGEQYKERNMKDFEYPLGFFEELANKNGMLISDVSNEYNHPRNQKMLVLRQMKRV
jgi:cyclopropane fatty-acyl-phospholipid synthase-like methyltransferase